jgi:hypothetical protein
MRLLASFFPAQEFYWRAARGARRTARCTRPTLRRSWKASRCITAYGCFPAVKSIRYRFISGLEYRVTLVMDLFPPGGLKGNPEGYNDSLSRADR